VKKAHPDVKGASGQEETKRLLLAYKQLMSHRTRPSPGPEGGDPFRWPEATASLLFVNELRCTGKRCSSSCVAKAPGVFHWASDTGAARVLSQNGATEYQLRVAQGQCPADCIHWVTPMQLAALEELLGRAVSGAQSLDEVGITLLELLTRAEYENGRQRTPSRPPPRTSTQYVDIYD
jgi:ferredoxin